MQIASITENSVFNAVDVAVAYPPITYLEKLWYTSIVPMAAAVMADR